ncbi:MAG: hypothetical protein HC936_11410, partial [Leptolyngbyaceae cyanobacterium SU_3_3]|nr:hypothetical protein [Leptolyngbyaceae cyanobacterium SU_3_3]
METPQPEEPLATLDTIEELDELEAIIDADSSGLEGDESATIVLDWSDPSPDTIIADSSTVLDFTEGGISGVTPGLPGMAAIAGGAALAAGIAAWAQPSDDLAQSDVEAAKFDLGQTDLTSETLATVDEGLPDLPDGYGNSRIVLLPRDPEMGAMPIWDVPIEHRMELRSKGAKP